MNLERNRNLKLNLCLNILRVGVSLLFPLIIFSYTSKTLGPIYLGKISFTNSIISYFALIASLGIPSYGIIVCAQKRENIEELRLTICELFYLNLILTAISYAFFIICIIKIERFANDFSLFLISSLSIAFSTIGFEWLYSALEDYAYITIRSLVFKIISLVLIFSFVKAQDDYLKYALILVIANAGSSILNFIHAREFITFYNPRKLYIKKHLRPVLTFFAASIAGTINANTDLVMLGFILGEYTVGIYSFSVKVKFFLTQIIVAGLTVMVPRFSHFVVRKDFQKYRLYIRKVFIITLSVAFALVGFVLANIEDMLVILGGYGYLEATMPMIVLTLCVIVLGVTWTFGVGVLQPLGLEVLYTKVMFIACATNITLNALLIPNHGATGAALATLITEILNGILFYNYSRPFLEDCLEKNSLWKNILPLICSILSSYILKSTISCSFFVSFLLRAVTYFSIYVTVIFFTYQELRDMIRFFLRRKKVENIC